MTDRDLGIVKRANASIMHQMSGVKLLSWVFVWSGVGTITRGGRVLTPKGLVVLAPLVDDGLSSVLTTRPTTTHNREEGTVLVSCQVDAILPRKDRFVTWDANWTRFGH